jgi:hypothetical protein|tara:strand:+ start:1204 stop:1548 length:345 start_codon:yes stop_codon:yes gene_type:complete
MNKKDAVWLANYYYRTKVLATKALQLLESMNIQPKHKEREVQRYTLKQYIEFLGMKDAAEKFDCSIASVKAWRYGYRQPSVDQAKKIIRASNGRLDFESIYGNLDSILADSVQS